MNTPTVLEPPWTLGDLAAACNVSTSYVRKCIGAGSLEVHRQGRMVRIAAPEARRFAAELGAVPLEPAHQAHNEHDAHQAHAVKLKLAKR
jgi:hypothetical protein